MERKKATRKAVPMCIAISSPTGQGKTYSALLVAAGLAKGGKVGFIDTEHGRGSMYADDLGIIKAMPQGYDVVEITEPYTPEKYIEALRLLSDCAVTIVDSVTHEWEGSGGCMDIAENNKLGGLPNWAKAKLSHKRFMNVVTQSSPHLIFGVRAREKSKPGKDDKGKTIMIECGMQPIQEKNFMFDMTISMLLDENYRPIITKCPKPLQHLFENRNPLTKEIGEKLGAWAESGENIDKILRQLKQQCREAAMFGNTSLDKFFMEMSPENKKMLTGGTDKDFQVEVRALANEADLTAHESEDHEESTQTEDPLFGNISNEIIVQELHPAKLKAKEIISLIQCAENIQMVNKVMNENNNHMIVMDDNLRNSIWSTREEKIKILEV